MTFEAAAGAFKKLGVPFGAEKFGALGMTQNNGGLFTNLALLVSDQCMHTTKVAVFGDAANTVFKDSREFGGSIFSQLEETFSYLRLCNKTSATFKGLERIEKQDYPEEAVREALLNALVHRDYSFSGSIIINVNDQKMEFISIGGLLPGLSKEDIMLGISQPRNRNLAEMFHRLRLIESYGTGIRRIFKLYEGCALQPEIEVTPNAFRLVLPNMNAPREQDRSEGASVTPQMQRVLEVLDQKGELTEAEIGELLGVKATRAFTVAKQMRDLGLIEARGRGRYKKYIRL